MYFMNSPTMPGQNSSGEKAAIAGQRRGDHRPGHPLGGELEGRLARHALGHAALGELGDDDRVVDQHADREDQAEQHDDVHGQPRQRQAEDADQERDRDREADQDRRPAGEREQDDDEDQHHGGQHAVLQVGEQLADVGRLVLAEADHRALGHHRAAASVATAFTASTVSIRLAPVRLETSMAMAGWPFTPGDGLGVLEGRPHRGEVAGPHHRVRAGDDRQVGDVLGGLDQRRDLDGVAALGALERAGGDQAVVGADPGDQLVELQPVGRELHRVDDHLDEVVAHALQRGVEHARHLLDRGRAARAPPAVSSRSGTSPDSVTTSTGNSREVDLVHRRLVDAVGQVGLGVGDLVAHVLQRLVEVGAGLELDHDVAAALVGAWPSSP